MIDLKPEAIVTLDSNKLQKQAGDYTLVFYYANAIANIEKLSDLYNMCSKGSSVSRMNDSLYIKDSALTHYKQVHILVSPLGTENQMEQVAIACMPTE